MAACHSSSGGDPPQTPPANPPSNPPATPVVGLDARPANATCVAPAKASSNAGATIGLERAFPNLTFDMPVKMLQSPSDDSRWYVVEKGGITTTGTGRVKVFANTPDVATASTFASLPVNADSEAGLLGMAFHPTNGDVFLSFTEGDPMVLRTARFDVASGGATLDMGSRSNVISFNQTFNIHKGGNIDFSPRDGYLYIGLGDGGTGGDPYGTGQDTTDMIGSFLRIDVNGAAPYAIPPDNPFAGGALCNRSHFVSANNCPEIYAWGFRNPWRWSFDRTTGDLWAGDVGQSTREEVNRVELGRNYGWDCREGDGPYATAAGGGPAPVCSTLPTSGFTEPAYAYGRNLGASVTGGFVYRGRALPSLVGSYLFADYVSGRIWRLVANGSGGYTAEQLLDTSYAIAAFGQGNDGELYVVDIAAGALYKIVDGTGSAPPVSNVKTLLSETGCVVAANPTEPAPGVVPYGVAAPFWSDGAAKDRWLAIPNGTSIAVGGDGDFTFPNGTVLMKSFRLGGKLVETRLFMRHPDGDWAGYSYEWNAQGTNATLVQGRKTVAVGAQSWTFPSDDDCLRCHTPAAGFALGLESAQLNRDFTYASTGRTANELRTLDSITMFTTPLGDPATQPKLPDPFDTSTPLGDRARAYLHTNCSQCHRPGGPTPVALDFRHSTLLTSTGACDVAPANGDLGLGAAARVIAPGNPNASVLVARMNRRDADQMPPLTSAVVDAAGVALIREWITSLATCR